MASEDVKTCQKLAAKAKKLAKTLTDSMDGHADLTSVHQCMDALLATQSEFEIAFAGVAEIPDEAQEQLQQVLVGLRQNVAELGQQVTTYGSEQERSFHTLMIMRQFQAMPTQVHRRVVTVRRRLVRTRKPLSAIVSFWSSGRSSIDNAKSFNV